MSESGQGFEPKIVAYICNWCTYLGADLAGTNRLEYPPNVRLIRLPCTGRIDFNLIIKAFEIGADGVLVSGCHPGDCHYSAGNYHARRRWMLFRDLLDTLGFDLERIHFSWISAAEGRKWQQTITEITEKTRRLGPYKNLYAKAGDCAECGTGVASQSAPAVPVALPGEADLRQTARRLLEENAVQVVIGYGERSPVFITRPEQADTLVWNSRCRANLTTYLKKKEIRSLGKPAVVVKGCDERSLVVREKENQLVHDSYHAIGMACGGMEEAKCDICQVHTPRFSHEVIGQAAERPGIPSRKNQPIDELMAQPPAERMAFWYALENRGKYGNITIVYGARTVSDLVFVDELDQWAFHERVRVICCVDPGGEVPSWTGEIGFVPTVFERAGVDARNAAALVIGPPIMIMNTLPVLDRLGMGPEDIYTSLENRMKCGVGKCGRCNAGPVYVCKEGPVFTMKQLQQLPVDY